MAVRASVPSVLAHAPFRGIYVAKDLPFDHHGWCVAANLLLDGRGVLVLIAGGLPWPVTQYEVFRPDGSFVARLDLAYPTLRIGIERLDRLAFRRRGRPPAPAPHRRDHRGRARESGAVRTVTGGGLSTSRGGERLITLRS